MSLPSIDLLLPEANSLLRTKTTVYVRAASRRCKLLRVPDDESVQLELPEFWSGSSQIPEFSGRQTKIHTTNCSCSDTETMPYQSACFFSRLRLLRFSSSRSLFSS